MKHGLAIIVMTAMSANAFAALPKKTGAKAEPSRIEVEKRERESKKSGETKAEAGRLTVDDFKEARKEQMKAPTVDTTKWAVERIEAMVKRANEGGAKVDPASKNAVIEGMKNNIDIKQAVGSLDAAVKKLTFNGARLDVQQQDLVRVAVDWLAKASAEPADRLVNIHMVFEDALINSYSKNITEILEKALKVSKAEGRSIRDVTLDVLQERGISEKDILTCEKKPKV